VKTPNVKPNKALLVGISCGFVTDVILIFQPEAKLFLKGSTEMDHGQDYLLLRHRQRLDHLEPTLV
jgi:hypothetical protein